MELTYKIQNYEWGKRGTLSKVATLYKNHNPKVEINKELPYSELWLGTHVNGPSSVKVTGELLSDLIGKHPEYLGETVIQQFGRQLPFLFKILSVNQALSIQAHPSKRHAEELHAKRPDLYKDPNHKPELAIALTPFEALCGFRPLEEIYSYIRLIPEFASLIGEEILKKYNHGHGHSRNDIGLLKEAFRAVLTAPKALVAEQLDCLLDRFKTLTETERLLQLSDLIERLYFHYPGDVGCFIVYFLNYLKLKPSQAIYLGANEPHAYLYGDCVECMACSDNVVRAGLTPKFIDVETLCSMLDYKGENLKQKIFKPIEEDEFCKKFSPPVPDFAVIQIKVPSTVANYNLKPRSSASTLLVVSGNGRTNSGISLSPGTALFLPATATIAIVNVTEDLTIYQGLANV